MKTYKEFISEGKLKIAKVVFNSQVVKSLFKDSLRGANQLPREIPKSMKIVNTGPFPKNVIDARKGYLRNVRQGYITPTPEPIKGMTGATTIGKPKSKSTGIQIHPDEKRLPKHKDARGVKTKGVKTSDYEKTYFNPEGESDIVQYMKAKKINDPDLEYYKIPIVTRKMKTLIAKQKRIKDKQDRLNKLYKKGDMA